MLNKKISVAICVIYMFLIGFYIHSINSGETTQFKEFSWDNLVFYCCEDNANCGYQEIGIQNVLLSNYSNIIPEVKGIFNVQYFDDFRCNMKEITNLSEISTWMRNDKIYSKDKILEKYCFKHPENEPKLMVCEYKLETFEKLTVGITVITILSCVAYFFSKKYVRQSLYGKCVIGIVGALPNIVTLRLNPENSLIFVVVSYLAFIMLPTWMFSIAFEDWHSTKNPSKDPREAKTRHCNYTIFVHAIFFVLLYPYLWFLFQKFEINGWEFKRIEIAERFCFLMKAVLVIYISVMIILNSLTANEINKLDKTNSKELKDHLKQSKKKFLGNVIFGIAVFVSLLMCYITYYQTYGLMQNHIRQVYFIQAITEIFTCFVFLFIFVAFSSEFKDEMTKVVVEEDENKPLPN